MDRHTPGNVEHRAGRWLSLPLPPPSLPLSLSLSLSLSSRSPYLPVSTSSPSHPTTSLSPSDVIRSRRAGIRPPSRKQHPRTANDQECHLLRVLRPTTSPLSPPSSLVVDWELLVSPLVSLLVSLLVVLLVSPLVSLPGVDRNGVSLRVVSRVVSIGVEARPIASSRRVDCGTRLASIRTARRLTRTAPRLSPRLGWRLDQHRCHRRHCIGLPGISITKGHRGPTFAAENMTGILQRRQLGPLAVSNMRVGRATNCGHWALASRDNAYTPNATKRQGRRHEVLLGTQRHDSTKLTGPAPLKSPSPPRTGSVTVPRSAVAVRLGHALPVPSAADQLTHPFLHGRSLGAGRDSGPVPTTIARRYRHTEWTHGARRAWRPAAGYTTRSARGGVSGLHAATPPTVSAVRDRGLRRLLCIVWSPAVCRPLSLSPPSRLAALAPRWRCVAAALPLCCRCVGAALPLRCRCVAAALPLCCRCVAAALPLCCRCVAAALPLCCRCVAAALPLRCRCVAAALALRCRRVAAALPLRCRCVAAALPLRCRCVAAVLPLRCRCVGAALPLCWRCVAAVLPLCWRCVAAVLPLRCRCVAAALALRCRRVAAALPLRCPATGDS